MREENTGLAYKFIRSKILAGEYAPGYPLRAEILSKDIGVSRTPVRDALRRLEGDGLVTMRPRQGAVVKYLSLQEYRDLCGFRLALEIHAAGLAATYRNESELEEIANAVQSMRKVAERLDEGFHSVVFENNLAKEDIRFHMGVMTAAKNAMIKDEILRLHAIDRVVSGVTPIYVAGSSILEEERVNIARTIKEHAEIYAAIQAKNAEAARAAMQAHIQDVIDHTILRMGAKETSHVSSELGY